MQNYFPHPGTQEAKRIYHKPLRNRNKLSDVKSHCMITSSPAEIANHNHQVEHMKKMKKQSAARKKLESTGGL